MPHAENGKMGEPTVNGDMPSSQFLSHLSSYPIISDSITTLKNNAYGQKSLKLADQGYVHIAKPMLPYFAKPYEYVAPYLAKADSLGDQGLSHVESKFPIVKRDTQAIKGTLKDYAFLPIRIANDGKRYIFDTYTSEYKKCGGEGYVARGKALITTGLVMTSESLAWLSGFLGAKSEQAKEAKSEKKTE
jgi:hypothetical protein